MGHFCVTRSNPTHQLTDPIQPNPLLVEKFGPNPTNSCVNPTRGQISIFCTYAIVDPTQRNPPKTEKSLPNLWVNPTHGTTLL